MDKKNKNPNVPNLRFTNNQLKDFKIVDICKLKQGNQYDLKQQFTEEKPDLKRFIRIVDYTQKTNDIRYVYSNGSENYVDCTDVVVVRYGASAGYVGRGINGIIANNLFTIRPINSALLNKSYLYHYLNAPVIQKQLNNTQSSGMPALNFQTINNLHILLPEYQEQRQIAVFLDKIDERIQTQIKIIDTLSSQKKQIRNLIFKDIHKNANCCIQDYVIYEQPQKYIVHSTDYLSYGKDYTPVLTANQSFILGYTLEKDGIYEKGDCIIFDDFTNENKYVDFPFKVKSSALKILQTKEGLMLKFFYEYLQFLNFESTDHKRHYLSEVAVTDISVPNLKEQTFVCKIFTSFDNKLKNEEALLEKYRLQKQFFLNNLFI